MNFIHQNENINFFDSKQLLDKLDDETEEKILEAVLFAAKEPLNIYDLKKECPFIRDLPSVLSRIIDFYSNRAINLVKIKNSYAFRTSPEYGKYIKNTVEKKVKLSKAAKETLAIIAYHQPITRTEIEKIRGVTLYKGLIDSLLETKWIGIGTRRDTPGTPVTFITTNKFLDHFGLETVKDMPNFMELKEVGFVSNFQDVDTLVE